MIKLLAILQVKASKTMIKKKIVKDDDKQDHHKKVALHSFIFKNTMKTFDDFKNKQKSV